MFLSDEERNCLLICTNHYIEFHAPIKLDVLMHEMQCSMHTVRITLLRLVAKKLIKETDKYAHYKTIPTFLSIGVDKAKVKNIGIEL